MPGMQTQLRMGAAEWGLLVLLSLLWGGSFFFGAVAVRELPPLTVALGRVALAAGALLAVCALLRLRLPARLADWRPYLVMGALNNLVPFSLILWGQTQIASGLASILNATTPLFAVVLAHLWTADERLTWNRLAGVLAGVAGVAVMMGPDAVRGLGGGVLAQLAVLGAAFSYALAGIYGKRFREQPPLATAACQLLASTGLLLPLALVVDRPWTLAAVSAPALWSLAGLALLSTSLAYVLYFRILATSGATNILLVTLLIPVSAILLGVGLLEETLSARQLVGMAFIALALLVVDGRLPALVATAARPRRPGRPKGHD